MDRARTRDQRHTGLPAAQPGPRQRHEKYNFVTIACCLARPPPARAPRPRGSRACRRPCRTTSSAGRASFGSAPSPARAAAPTRRCMSHRSRRSCLHGPGIESAALGRHQSAAAALSSASVQREGSPLGPRGQPRASGWASGAVGGSSERGTLSGAVLPRMSCSESARISSSST